MTKIKYMILTLVALMAVTTGAWAQTWTNIVVNSDMEGTDVSCFYVNEQAGGMYLARIKDGIGVDGSRAIKLQSTDNEANSWDTQFDIRLPYVLPAGTQYKLSFDYKTDKAGVRVSNDEDYSFGFQLANEPSQYVWWTLGGWPAPSIETTEENVNKWQHYEAEYTVPAECDGITKSDQGDWLLAFRTIYVNLSGNKVATEVVFDNVKVEILTSDLASLTPEPVNNPDLMKLYVTQNATNEWDFDMIAGDVELEVKYFDNAVLVDGTDVAPAASADPIYEGTDAALVTAGTASQGTLMYLALPATAEAPTKATEGWSADVPTASTITEAGTYNVYYYIAGDDEHSNSDILGPVAVEVLTTKFDVTFQAANANTIEAGKATVKVGDDDATLTDGKLTGVEKGQKVTINAVQGYKFRSVEVKKTVKLLSITVGAVTVYYAEGESWATAIQRDENKDSGLFIREGNRVHHPDYGQLVDSNTQPVLPDDKIIATETYSFVK